MSTFSTKAIAPPSTWQEFEQICCDVWAEELNDPTTQLNGRGGQLQNGVDFYGRQNQTGSLTGVQCKGKDGRYGSFVEEAELLREVKKALGFEPPLDHFILATTVPNDAKIQLIARQLSAQHIKKGLFTVSILGWDEILQRISKYDHLVAKHYKPLSEGTQESKDMFQKLFGLHEEILESQRRIEANHVGPGDVLSANVAIADVSNEFDKAINSQIDELRDMLVSGKPETAKKLLVSLKNNVPTTINKKTEVRIITNIAASDLRLGDNANAIHGFLLAYRLDESVETSASNYLLALLLQEDFEGAKKVGASLVEKFPYSTKIATNYIASFQESELELAKTYENRFPNIGNIQFALYSYHKRQGNISKANECIEKAISSADVPFEAKLAYSGDILDQIFSRSEVVYGQQWTSDVLAKLNTATSILEELFTSSVEAEGGLYLETISNNYAVAQKFQNNLDKACEIAEIAAKKLPDNLDIRRLHVSLLIEKGDWDSASAVSDNLDYKGDWNSLVIYLESKINQKNFNKASEAIDTWLDSRSLKVHEEDILINYKIEIIRQTLGNGANEATRKILHSKPSLVIAHVSYAKLLRLEGNEEDAKAQIEQAIQNLNEDYSYSDRLMIADEAYSNGGYRLALPLYEAMLHEPNIDSPILRRIISCLYEIDERKKLIDLFEGFPQELVESKYCARYAAGIYLRVGDFEKAETYLDIAHEFDPLDLNISINKLMYLLNAKRDDEARSFVETLSLNENDRPLDQMNLSQILLKLGLHERAKELAFRVRRQFHNNPEIHTRYAGFILLGGIENVSPTIVETDCLVTLSSGKDSRKYFICSENTTPLTSDEIKCDHPIAHSLLGHSINEPVVLHINPIESKEFIIDGVFNKHTYQLQETMDRYTTRFPTQGNMFPVTVFDEDGNLTMEPIIRSLQQRRDYVNEQLMNYRNLPIPVALTANQIGTNPIELWTNLQADETQIICCLGSHEERHEAMKLIAKFTDVVVDPLTLINIHRYGMIRLLKKVFGSISTPESTIDLFDEHIASLSTKNQSGYMTADGDGLRFVERTLETTREEREELIEIRDWIKSDITTTPALGGPSAIDFLNELVGKMHPCFKDCIYASSQGNTLFLSDDMRLRDFAKIGWGVDGLWIQPVLIEAKERGIISGDAYADTVSKYVNSGFEFISIDADVLRSLGDSKGYDSDSVLKALTTIGRPNSDIKSSLFVIREYLENCWRADSLLEPKILIVYSTLNAVTLQCTNKNTRLIVLWLVSRSSNIAGSLAPKFMSALQLWCAGHFLEWDSLIEGKNLEFNSK